MRVDCHLHIDYRGLTENKLLNYLDRNHIDKCWLLSWEEDNPCHSIYRHLNVEAIIEVYQKYPSRIVPMYAPDPTRDSASDELLKWYSRGIRGIAELKVGLNWNSTSLDKILKMASEYKLPILFHMEEGRGLYQSSSTRYFEEKFCLAMSTNRYNGLIGKIGRSISRFILPFNNYLKKTYTEFPGYLTDFDSLEKRLDEYPDVIFIGHGPLFWKGISKDQSRLTYPKGSVKEAGDTSRLLDEKDNLYADLSGGSGFNALARDLDHAKVFIEKYHKKILYGTDNASNRIDGLLNSIIDDRQKYKRIMGNNAMEIMQK